MTERTPYEQGLEDAAKVADEYHVKALARVDREDTEQYRHEECASTAGSIAAAIRDLQEEDLE